MCRDCNRAYQRQHYLDNKDEYVAKAMAKQAAITAWLREYKEAAGCKDCGGKFEHYILDFDHVTGKTFDIAAAARSRSLAAVKNEVERCDVVCANCHRRRTWESGHFGHNPHTCTADHDTAA